MVDLKDQECEASWFLYEDIGVRAFFDYGTYMESLGMLRSTCCAAAASRNLPGTQRYLLKMA
ncbi:hypothetical protein JOE33_004852 [Pseudomonas sp. PvP027]|nr:hypothetical protein [Pseudomonas sp. PvP027]